jgi:hypothetical protein
MPYDTMLHASAERLLAYAVEASRADPQPIFQFSDLARGLHISAPTVSRWKKRGVSKGGAAAARMRYGCSPAWVLLGIGPRDMPNAGRTRTADSPLAAAAHDPSVILSAQAVFLRSLDEPARRQAVEVLKRFLDAPQTQLESALELELIIAGNWMPQPRPQTSHVLAAIPMRSSPEANGAGTSGHQWKDVVAGITLVDDIRMRDLGVEEMKPGITFAG